MWFKAIKGNQIKIIYYYQKTKDTDYVLLFVPAILTTTVIMICMNIFNNILSNSIVWYNLRVF